MSVERSSNKKVAAVTLGCRLNQADTGLLFDRFRRAGYDIVDTSFDGNINVLVVNTCTVTGAAAQKSRQAVRKLRKQHPSSCIVVTGCSTEMERVLWHKESTVDLVVPNSEKVTLVSRLEHHLANGNLPFVEPLSDAPVSEDETLFRECAQSDFPFRSRAFLKIQEGCNAFCSYCIVPHVRGRERSREWDEILEDFKKLLDRGYREIILTGVNISTYSHCGRKLCDLLGALVSISGKFRVRLSSTEPHPDNRALLDVMSGSSKVCRFLHLPLQHGSNRVLKAMNRRYTTDDFANFVHDARSKITGLHIGTDVIVGFPGESEADFSCMSDFIEEVAFANTHIFTFSPREGTPAFNFTPKVSASLAKERYKHLNAITSKLSTEFTESMIGSRLQVLVESCKEIDSDIFVEGWSDNYVRVRARSNVEIETGTLVDLIPSTITGHKLFAYL